MLIEIGQVRDNSVAGRARSLHRVSLRSALMVGVAALGIVAALPDAVAPTRSELSATAAASVAAPLRVSSHDVELMAYIPGWTDAMIAIDEISIAAEPVVTNTVNTLASIGNSIPVVNVFARQAYIIYNYVIWPIVWLPTSCGVLFLGTLDVGYLNHWISVTAQLFAGFVQAEANYFLYGGWNPFAAAAASALVKARTAAGDETDSGKTPSGHQAKPSGSGLGKSRRGAAPISDLKDPSESTTDTGTESTKVVAAEVGSSTADVSGATGGTAQVDNPTQTKNAGSSRAASGKRGPGTSSSSASSHVGGHKAGTGHPARRSGPAN